MDTFDIVMTVLFAIVVLWFFIYLVTHGIRCVKEKETVIVERLGRFSRVLTPGIACYVPFLDRTKKIKSRYLVSDASDKTQMVKRVTDIISTQNEVLNFPKQAVITRDNAKIYLDAVLQYHIVNAKQMAYSVTNLPNVLSKLLQAQLRDVAGSLDVDRIIEDTAILDRVSGELDLIARNWGVRIDMVKIQRVQTGSLEEVLSQKKNADFHNKEVIIAAKSSKQTAIINAEGQRDQKIREAEGEAQRIVASAHGQAQAVLNEAQSEARSIQEISRSLEGSGDDPIRYLLSLKYIDALKTICAGPNVKVVFVPQETLMVQTAQLLGLNTILPPKRA
ncbi:hypothetical protein WA538_005565 [Blastocystis sp. DL]